MQHVEEKIVPSRGRRHGANVQPTLERHRGANVQPAFETERCVFFANGSCIKGSLCHFSHSFSAPKPVCKFFLTLQGCRNGNSCPYSHGCGSLISSSITSGISLQEGRATSLCCTKLLPADGNGHILVLNDRSLEFSKKLCQYCDASKIVACTPSVQSIVSVPKDLKILHDLADPSLLIIGREHRLPVAWTKVQRVIWFADFDNDESSSERVLLQKFFEHMAIKILSEPFSDLQVILIMKNTKYIFLQVERMARECFFFLGESFMFDEATLGWFSDILRYPRGVQISAPVVYVFTMHRPSTIQFGDYPAELRKALRRD